MSLQMRCWKTKYHNWSFTPSKLWGKNSKSCLSLAWALNHSTAGAGELWPTVCFRTARKRKWFIHFQMVENQKKSISWHVNIIWSSSFCVATLICLCNISAFVLRWQSWVFWDRNCGPQTLTYFLSVPLGNTFACFLICKMEAGKEFN